MDFFGLGFGEIVLILIVALVIWGPKRIPDIARTLGRTVRALRKATSDFTTAVTTELNTEEKDQRPSSGANRHDKMEPSLEVNKIQPNGTETASPRDE